MKKILLTVTGFIAVAMLFTGVGYAAATWLNFTGDEQIKQSESDVDEIMQILRDTHDGKLDAESALAELEDLNPKGLVDNIKKLEKDLGDKDKIIANHVSESEQLKQTKAQLNTDLAQSNKAKTDAENALAGKQEELNSKQAEIEQKQQEIQEKIEEGNRKVAEKQAELDGVAQQRDEHKRVAEELQQQINQNSEYVEHLERELQRANKTVAEYGQTTQEAVEEARTYK